MWDKPLEKLEKVDNPTETGIIAPTRIKAPLRHRNFYYSPGYNSSKYGMYYVQLLDTYMTHLVKAENNKFHTPTLNW